MGPSTAHQNGKVIKGNTKSCSELLEADVSEVAEIGGRTEARTNRGLLLCEVLLVALED